MKNVQESHQDIKDQIDGTKNFLTFFDDYKAEWISRNDNVEANRSGQSGIQVEISDLCTFDSISSQTMKICKLI